MLIASSGFLPIAILAFVNSGAVLAAAIMRLKPPAESTRLTWAARKNLRPCVKFGSIASVCVKVVAFQCAQRLVVQIPGATVDILGGFLRHRWSPTEAFAGYNAPGKRSIAFTLVDRGVRFVNIRLGMIATAGDTVA